MTTKAWLVGALVAGGVVYTTSRGCINQMDPDQKLAAQLGDICDIARDNLKTPEPGVRAIGRYLVKHGGEITGELGSTIAMIERIDDDDAHDKRAGLARDRLGRRLRGCEAHWSNFLDAVEADPAATELVQHALDRLGRTLEIILAGSKVDLRHLPQQLEHAFDH